VTRLPRVTVHRRGDPRCTPRVPRPAALPPPGLPGDPAHSAIPLLCPALPIPPTDPHPTYPRSTIPPASNRHAVPDRDRRSHEGQPISNKEAGSPSAHPEPLDPGTARASLPALLRCAAVDFKGSDSTCTVLAFQEMELARNGAASLPGIQAFALHWTDSETFRRHGQEFGELA